MKRLDVMEHVMEQEQLLVASAKSDQAAAQSTAEIRRRAS